MEKHFPHNFNQKQILKFYAQHIRLRNTQGIISKC